MESASGRVRGALFAAGIQGVDAVVDTSPVSGSPGYVKAGSGRARDAGELVVGVPVGIRVAAQTPIREPMTAKLGLLAAVLLPVLAVACSSASPVKASTANASTSSSPSDCLAGTSYAIYERMPGPDAPPDPIYHLMPELVRALSCNFSGVAMEPPGSYHYVIYLAPLDAHTRAVAEAVIARYPGVIVSLAAGKQSLAQAEQRVQQMPRKKCTIYTVDRDGSVIVLHGCFQPVGGGG
jgi:hypothetical protein